MVEMVVPVGKVVLETEEAVAAQVAPAGLQVLLLILQVQVLQVHQEVQAVREHKYLDLDHQDLRDHQDHQEAMARQTDQ